MANEWVEMQMADKAIGYDRPALCQLGRYQHWKGAFYRVLFVARDTTIPDAKADVFLGTGWNVVYLQLTTGNIFTRPLAEFNENVTVHVRNSPDGYVVCDKEQAHGTTSIPRFRYCGE